MSLVMTDYNGTFDEHPELWGKVEGIITGTSWEDYRDFMNEKVGPDLPIFFNPKAIVDLDLRAICDFKANTINTAGVTKYYENEPKQAQMLKILCPDCEIVLVHEFETAI